MNHIFNLGATFSLCGQASNMIVCLEEFLLHLQSVFHSYKSNVELPASPIYLCWVLKWSITLVSVGARQTGHVIRRVPQAPSGIMWK